MAEQLHRLAELSRLPTVELGIIPIDTDMPSRYGPSFDLYDDVDGAGESLVVVELESNEVREDDPDRVAFYRRRHEIYWSAAITGTAATDSIERLARQMTTASSPDGQHDRRFTLPHGRFPRGQGLEPEPWPAGGTGFLALRS